MVSNKTRSMKQANERWKETVKCHIKRQNPKHFRQRTKVIGIIKNITKTKWKWAGYIARMKDNRRIIRSTEWSSVRSVR